ncbi:hypothetical protein MMC22_004078 [Lobaria immixta]|nr:hypothetical protein [Lobaria immixta]
MSAEPRLTIKQMTGAESLQMGALLTGVEKITSLIGRCQIYEALYLKGEHSNQEPWKQPVINLTSALVALYSTMLSFMGSAIRAYDQGTITRTLHPIMNPAEVIDFLDKCQALENAVVREVDDCEHILQASPEEHIQKLKQILDDMQAPMRIDSRVAALCEELNISERLRLLEWISNIRYEENHFHARQGRIRGTGEWLLQHERYREWRTSSASMILWLHGDQFGSALQAASSDGYKSVVQLLLEAGADVNASGGCFDSALQAAAWRGSESVVRLLLEKGADVDAEGGEDGSALQAASSEGHQHVVRLLL